MVFLFGSTFANANQWGESSNNVTWECVPTCPSSPGFRQTICPSWPSPKWTTKHSCHRIRVAAVSPGIFSRQISHKNDASKKSWYECACFYWGCFMTWRETKVYCILLDVPRIQILQPLDARTPFCKSWSQRWLFFLKSWWWNFKKIFGFFIPYILRTWFDNYVSHWMAPPPPSTNPRCSIGWE